MERGKPLKILCIDEDEFLLHMEERMLKRVCPNAMVSTAIGTDEALTRIQEEEFHLIFCEINSNRFDVESFLNFQPPLFNCHSIKVGLGGYALPAKMRKHFDFFLEKPFSLQDMERLFNLPEFRLKIKEFEL